MSEFATLRKAAKDKRDKIIESAQRDYETTLKQIASLEKSLRPTSRLSTDKLSANIDAVIPADKEFTVRDVRASLEAMDPCRVWHRRPIENHIFHLRQHGVIVRIKRANLVDPAVYIRAGAKFVPRSPLGDMTLVEAMRHVLKEKPLTSIEVAVAVLEAGYKTLMPNYRLRNRVSRELSKGRFTQKAGKWVVG